MPKPWAAALVALLVLAGCETLAEEGASPSPTEEVSAEEVDRATGAQAAAVGEGDGGGDGTAYPGSSGGDQDEAPDHPDLGLRYPVVSVYDGDTIAVEIDGVKERVRIIGIDAPELAKFGADAECFAQESASRMQSLVQSQEVYLLADGTQADRDRYDRLLRHVVLDDEEHSHAGLLMVEGGYAVERQFAAPYEHQGDLRTAQDRARGDGLGLWSACAAADATPGGPAGTVEPTQPAAPPVVPVAPPASAPPATTPVEPAPTATGECVIKGNIASDGEKIYHVPGQRYYDETKISLEKGERWFCTEQDAVDAGWRRAKV